MNKIILAYFLILAVSVNSQICFDPAINTSVGQGLFPQAIASGDFNNDGKPDLGALVQDSAGVSLFIMLGNGSGSFNVLSNYQLNSGARIISGDFNGDGNIDLATSAMSLLLGNGAGGFSVV